MALIGAGEQQATRQALSRSTNSAREEGVEVIGARLREQLQRFEESLKSTVDFASLRRAVQSLRQLQAAAWRGLAEGDLEAPKSALAVLKTVQVFADRHAGVVDRGARFAVEIHANIWSFYVASEELGHFLADRQLASGPSSATEREVLAVLAQAGGEFLRRKQVYDELSISPRPTVSRVGQVLLSLYERGLLVRLQASAQGNPETAFYQLSALGREEVERLQLAPVTDQEVEFLADLVAVAGSADVSFARRRLACGWLSRESLGHGGARIAQMALANLRRQRGTPSELIARRLYVEILASLLSRLVIEPGACGSFQVRTDDEAWGGVPSRLLDPAVVPEEREDSASALHSDDLLSECLIAGVLEG